MDDSDQWPLRCLGTFMLCYGPVTEESCVALFMNKTGKNWSLVINNLLKSDHFVFKDNQYSMAQSFEELIYSAIERYRNDRSPLAKKVKKDAGVSNKTTGRLIYNEWAEAVNLQDDRKQIKFWQLLDMITPKTTSAQSFESAQKQLNLLKGESSGNVNLQIGASFNEASTGDVSGSRPGMMGFVGRAKFDAWANVKGSSQDDAKVKYAELPVDLSKTDTYTQEEPAGTIEGLKPVDGLSISVEGKTYNITLNRPNKFDATTLPMYEGLIAELEASSKNPTTTVTVISGLENNFCFGNDLGNFAKAATASKAEIKALAERLGAIFYGLVQAYIDHPKPIIGLIDGPAAGIAVTVLPIFDYILSVDDATYDSPDVTLGQAPEGAYTHTFPTSTDSQDDPTVYTFPLLMGQLKASEVLLFGKKCSAITAQEYGLVNKVVGESEFKVTAERIVEEFGSLPAESLMINKCLLRNVHKQQMTEANETECKNLIDRWQSKECAQAIAAFMARSKK